MMEVFGKSIKDECQYCGEILQCEKFKKGHGIDQERSGVSDMVKCQMRHWESRVKDKTDES